MTDEPHVGAGQSGETRHVLGVPPDEEHVDRGERASDLEQELRPPPRVELAAVDDEGARGIEAEQPAGIDLGQARREAMQVDGVVLDQRAGPEELESAAADR